MKMPGGHVRIAIALVALALLASACGARVTDAQRASAAGPPSGGARKAAVGAGAAEAGGDSDTTAGATPPTAAASAAAGSPSGAGAAAGEAATATPAAPAGGNGGATDVGVTASSIDLGLVTTLTGPVPGLFQGAVIGAQAFVAYANSQGGIFGRKLRLTVRDDQFDTGQNRTVTTELAGKVTAFLGSFSTYDDAGLPAIQAAKVADVGYGLTDGRRTSPFNFSIQPAKSRTFRTGAFEWYARKFPDAVKAMGTIYGDIPASKQSALDSMAAAESVGWKWAYSRGVSPTETDFTADVVRMKSSGVKGVYLVATDVKSMARLLKAMAQQSFRPELIALGASGYDASLPTLAGAAAEGVYVDQQLALYQGQDAGSIPEVALMNQWIKRVKPGYTPDLFAAYSWASGRLLLQGLQAAGPKLTRAGLVDALRKVDNFDANGLVAAAGPGSKRQPTCDLFMQIKGGQYRRVEPAGKGFLCGGKIFSH
jgi:ABC-type branched-subunit amino acid transport system substrate-binding protein